jgi:hypothetical protein
MTIDLHSTKIHNILFLNSPIKLCNPVFTYANSRCYYRLTAAGISVIHIVEPHNSSHFLAGFLLAEI